MKTVPDACCSLPWDELLATLNLDMGSRVNILVLLVRLSPSESLSLSRTCVSNQAAIETSETRATSPCRYGWIATGCVSQRLHGVAPVRLLWCAARPLITLNTSFELQMHPNASRNSMWCSVYNRRSVQAIRLRLLFFACTADVLPSTWAFAGLVLWCPTREWANGPPSNSIDLILQQSDNATSSPPYPSKDLKANENFFFTTSESNAHPVLEVDPQLPLAPSNATMNSHEFSPSSNINNEVHETLVLDPLTTIPQASIFESLSRFTVLGVVDVEIESSSSLSLTRGLGLGLS
ncbi:hypothetical protein DY000_02046817 [Brassica cretica]|uniref:Uncharacterized protein n=1 Tax=Brassica cretica TaxID=69181 RepID=A0ABQ7F1V4_BRACR|nr:hypothetical protein DY000_02046817 [Brassica cretica]